MTSTHPPNPDPDPVSAEPIPNETPLLAPCTAHDPRFQAEFDRALEHMTDLLMNLSLPEVGAIAPGADGLIKYSLRDQIGELSERAIFIERATRKLEAAKVTIMGRIPSAIEEADADAQTAHTSMLSVANQIAVATRSSDQTVGLNLNASYEIIDRYPELVELIQAGRVSFAHAKVIAHSGANLPENVRDTYLKRATEIALETTPGRLRRRLPKLVASLSPESIEVARKHASEERRVWVKDTGDGMAMFGAILPAPIALAAYDRLTRIARQTMQPMTATEDTSAERIGDGKATTKTIADARTLTQARADVMSELLLASASARVDDRSGDPFGFGIQGRVQVTVPVTAFVPADNEDPATAGSGHEAKTSREASPEPFGELAGYGLIDAEISRRFAADAKSWNRIFVGPSGKVISTDSYEPTAAIRRLIIARDSHCRFPGCLTPPSRCEIDHTFDWAKGGKTATNNLALLCKRHHALKHPSVHETARWSVRQEPGGVLVWRDPHGNEYTDTPDPATEVEPLVPPITPERKGRKSKVRFKYYPGGDIPWGAHRPGLTGIPEDERPF